MQLANPSSACSTCWFKIVIKSTGRRTTHIAHRAEQRSLCCLHKNTRLGCYKYHSNIDHAGQRPFWRVHSYKWEAAATLVSFTTPSSLHAHHCLCSAPIVRSIRVTRALQAAYQLTTHLSSMQAHHMTTWKQAWLPWGGTALQTGQSRSGRRRYARWRCTSPRWCRCLY